MIASFYDDNSPSGMVVFYNVKYVYQTFQNKEHSDIYARVDDLCGVICKDYIPPENFRRVYIVVFNDNTSDLILPESSTTLMYFGDDTKYF